eukprot:g1806.t1
MREGAVRRVLDGLQGSGTQAELQVSSSGQQNFHGFGGILQRVPFSQLQEAALEAKDEQRCPIWSKSKEVDCPAEHLLPQACELLPFLRSALGDANSSAWAQRLESVNLWASIGDTHSNLHYDSKHGLLIILRGSKVVEVFPPSSTLHLGAYPVHDPLRSHHSKVPHCCLAARLQGQRCTSGSSQCWPCFPKAQSFQAELHLGDALLIPEGWWHHVKTSGVPDATTGQPVAIAMNLWWRQYPREPTVARPYLLRRLLGDMLAQRTGRHLRRSPRRSTLKPKRRGPTLRSLAQAADASQAPRHRRWLSTLRTVRSTGRWGRRRLGCLNNRETIQTPRKQIGHLISLATLGQ